MRAFYGPPLDLGRALKGAAIPPSLKALPDPEGAAAKGRRFLGGLLDPELGLLPEYRGAKVYWLYHDNYLAAQALARTDPDLAKKVTAAIRSYGVGESGKIEILFGEAKKPLPFRQYRLVEVKTVGEKVIKAEVAGEEVFKGWVEYSAPRTQRSLAFCRACATLCCVRPHGTGRATPSLAFGTTPSGTSSRRTSQIL